MQEERFLLLRSALEGNLRLQDRLEGTLQAVELGIRNNADTQASVQVAAMRVNRTGWYRGLKRE